MGRTYLSRLPSWINSPIVVAASNHYRRRLFGSSGIVDGVAEVNTVRAPLRWAGSKRKSLATLREYVPESIGTYIEPFAGSACLAFSLQAEKIVLGDVNPRLVEFYTYLKADPLGLHQAYIAIPSNPESYYAIRKRYNSSLPSLSRAAEFLFLNRHCFNGIYRVNSAGHFNVPWGGDRVGKPLSRDDLVLASTALVGASFTCGDFEDVVTDSITPGCFVYLDPPYASDETRVFREYHEASFATGDWKRLVRVLQKVDQCGGKFLLSYAGTPPTELSRWKVGHLDVTRNVGGFKASRRKYREFIATNVA